MNWLLRLAHPNLKVFRAGDGVRQEYGYSVEKEHFRIADDGKSQDQDRGCDENISEAKIDSGLSAMGWRKTNAAETSGLFDSG